MRQKQVFGIYLALETADALSLFPVCVSFGREKFTNEDLETHLIYLCGGSVACVCGVCAGWWPATAAKAEAGDTGEAKR